MEGFSPDQIIKTGSPKEAIEYVMNNKNSQILEKLKIKQNEYVVLSAHREENVDNKLRLIKLIESVNKLSDHYSKKIIFSIHPRTRKNVKKWGIQISPNYNLIKPLGLVDYLTLQKNSFLTIVLPVPMNSNILKFHAINT